MPDLLSAIPFIESSVKKDVSSLQNIVYEVNELQKNGEVTDLDRWIRRRRCLEDNIAQFNKKQSILAKHNLDISDTKQLLYVYFDQHTYIQAKQKVSKGYKSFVFITYHTKIIGFSEFFRSQYALYPNYIKMRKSFSALSFHIFENAKNHSYNNSMFFASGNNPYADSSYSSLIGYRLEQETTNSIGKLKQQVTAIVSALFSDDIPPITGKIIRHFIFAVCQKLDVEKLIDLFFLSYVHETKKIDYSEHDIDFSYGISRHVAWCVFRGKSKECILLGQPCHASEDCAFYKEDAAKKAHQK